MKDVTLNQQKQARLQVLNALLEYHLPTAQAAYRREGAAALVHGNRGRKPRNTVPEDIAEAVVVLAGEQCVGFNHSHCWQPAKVAHFETREIMGWMEVWRAP